jgi:hypothetical protein
MGYRIEYAVMGPVLLARVSGFTSDNGPVIAREIREEAKRAAIKHLMIDVRGLVDRLGNLSTLVSAAAPNQRIAIIDDNYDHARYQPFAEEEARRRNAKLRYFADAREALAWLGD